MVNIYQIISYLQDMQVLATFWFWISRPDPSQQPLHFQAGRRPAATILPRTALCAARLADNNRIRELRQGGAHWRTGICSAVATAQAGTTQRRTGTALGLAVRSFPKQIPGEEKWEIPLKMKNIKITRRLHQKLSTHLDFSGFSSFSLICDRSPTSSSSTLWLMPTEVSMNLQS